jgi:RimJ/RimL family protein N-acetyltransferase
MESPVLNTDRLTIDSLRPGDAEALFAYRGDPDVFRFQEWAPGSVEDAERFIRSVEATAFDTPGTWSQLAIRERGSGRLLGDLGVHFLEDGQQVEIGYTLAPESQGSGLATEAVTRLLDHLFRAMDKHRVTASVDPGNDSSIRLLTRVGMRQEAHFRESLWFKGAWADDLVFAALRAEWPPPTQDRDPR